MREKSLSGFRGTHGEVSWDRGGLAGQKDAGALLAAEVVPASEDGLAFGQIAVTLRI
jgi:hypothetical protein